jgi:sulfopyruvate decarboxylase subunit beta
VKRLAALELLARVKGDGVSVATMRAIQDWYGAGGAPAFNLDNRGCMGMAPTLGLGLALAQPDRRIIVIDGDGSLCMQLGGLVSIASEAPRNLYHFVLVNRIYETSGAQPIPAAKIIDFATMAKGAGYPHAHYFSDVKDFETCLPSIMDTGGPVLIALEVDQEPIGRPIPSTQPRDRAGYLRETLLGAI